MTRLVLGGYGPSLGVVDLDDEGFGEPHDVAPAQRPSWVVASADGRFVYAALEAEVGHVGAWAVTPDPPWRALGEQPTGGADPCHLALSPDGGWLLAANYSSGSVSVHPVHDDGSLGARTDLLQHTGKTGPVEDRQDGPHAHQVVFVDADRLLVCDLGLDAVIGYDLGPDGRLTEVNRSVLAAGTGPRHLALADGHAYVLGELASTVTDCRMDGLRLVPAPGVSTRAAGATGENTAGEIVLVGDEVLASNRGDDTVAVLTRGTNGLRLETTLSTGGSWPRWIGFVDDLLLVADERSDLVSAMRRRPGGWEVADETTWVAPTCATSIPSELASS